MTKREFPLHNMDILESRFSEWQRLYYEHYLKFSVGRAGTMFKRVNDEEVLPATSTMDPWDQDPETFFAELGEDSIYSYYPPIWQDRLQILLSTIYNNANKQSQREGNWYKLQNSYARFVLRSSPMTVPLRPQSYKSAFDDMIPYRDAIIHLENLHIIGFNMLNQEWAYRRKGIDLIWEKISSRDCEIGNALERVWNIRLADVPQKDRYALVQEAWNIACHCHEIGRAEREVSFERNLARVSSDRTIVKILRQKRRINSVLHDDHGELSAEYLLTQCPSQIEKLPFLQGASFLLAYTGLKEHSRILKNVNKKQYSGRLDTERIWVDNPIGAFLAMVILIDEISVRLCWYSEQVDLSRDDWRLADDIKTIIPVVLVNVALYNKKAEFIYETDENLGDIRTALGAGAQRKFEVLARIFEVALGSNGLGLLNKDQSVHLFFRWDNHSIGDKEVAETHVTLNEWMTEVSECAIDIQKSLVNSKIKFIEKNEEGLERVVIDDREQTKALEEFRRSLDEKIKSIGKELHELMDEVITNLLINQADVNSIAGNIEEALRSSLESISLDATKNKRKEGLIADEDLRLLVQLQKILEKRGGSLSDDQRRGFLSSLRVIRDEAKVMEGWCLAS